VVATVMGMVIVMMFLMMLMFLVLGGVIMFHCVYAFHSD
jgi:hypothetical protein